METASNNNVAHSYDPSANYTLPLAGLTALFFMWGFITCLNDILIPHLKNLFSLSYTQAMLIQFCFFGAYFIVSIPAGKLVNRLGYQKGIVAGLLLAALGCGMFLPAASLHSYPLFLAGLFTMASGITILQVSANPYVTALGPAETASSRLTMTQAFNSLGTTVAPFFGAMLILAAAEPALEGMSQAAIKAQEADAVKFPYLLLASSFVVLAIIFYNLKLPNVQGESANVGKLKYSDHPHLVLGAIGIFMYVGAEVAIGSFLVNFMGLSHIAGMDEATAAPYIAYYWGGARVGRFIGAVVMQKVKAGNVLAFNGVMVILLVTVAILAEGSLAMWALLAVGLFNSIMFPTIFSLGITGLGASTSQGAGLMCLGIVGGAIVPLFMGMIADISDIQIALILPAICYLFIVHYGLVGHKPRA
jgi:FHS family L-fucose permease-like MFS transporter